jgi:hypothetical protein
VVCHRQHLTLPRRGRCQPWLWMVSPEEVARAVRFLASENASAITGVNLPVDCPWLVRPPWHTLVAPSSARIMVHAPRPPKRKAGPEWFPQCRLLADFVEKLAS